METIVYVTENGRESRPIPVAAVEQFLRMFRALRAAGENLGLRQELSLARQRRRRVVDDAKRRALAMSAAKGRAAADGEPREFLDRLVRGIGQLKELADQKETALLRDAKRRRVERYTNALKR